MSNPVLPVHPQASSSSPLPELPWAFTDCPADLLVILISHMLDLLIQHNDQVILTPDALTRFHSRGPPGISVIEYLRRIVKYTNMEKIPLLSLLAYIDLTCQHLPTFTLSSLTVHRFLIAGVCAGSKAQCDVFCTNAHYAKVGGIKTQELNGLEREFLKVTQWDLCCNADRLQQYYTSLIRSHGGFTQASAPDISPFRAFPHSSSKPPSPVSSESGAEDEEGDGEMVGQGAQSPPEWEYGSPEEDARGREAGITIPVAEQSRPIPVVMTSGRPPDGVSTAQPVPAGMDVDQPDHSPFSAATSSSIPSSSRSSLRNSRPPPRGRTASLRFSDTKLAQPKVDRTSASGEGAAWATASVAEEQDEAKGHPHHQGGHLLRHLVGGIFRRDSHPDRPARHPPDDKTQPSSLVPLKPTFTRPSLPETIPPLLDRTIAAPPSIRSDPRSSPVRSPSAARSPGIAKPVTPRVRTRDERSVDSLKGRAAVGPSLGDSLSGVAGGDREDRRARHD